ncbi:hypothetical protein [Consotaella aegiceratis]|uniref:hypothetical protein n=1 Tax=Consotaella aegiceratis TaxID=3097961 RepID=UPI002F42234A
MTASKPHDRPEGRKPAKMSDAPPEGPHAKPELTNEDATPGAGTLPDVKHGGDADGGAG